jgi:D-alanyl-D-alanine carboxypeptidase
MARHEDPRRPSRLRRWLVAVVVVPAAVASASFGISALGGPALPLTSAAGRSEPVPSVGIGASASPSTIASGRAIGSAPPSATDGQESNPPPTPTPASTAPPIARHPSAGSNLSGSRAVVVRTRLKIELDRLRKRLGIPGVSVTIIFRDGTTWTGVSGRADVAGDVAVTSGTAFAVGSVSKTYTAALILALSAEGRIDLDASVRTYLPHAAISKRITIRQLLNHTSGLDDFVLHPPIDKALQGHPAARWDAVRSLKYVGKPYFPPGRGWHYSNTNYLYLGLVAERVTGQSLAEALRARFFDRLGLDATWYQAAEKSRAPGAHGYRFVGTKSSAKPIDLSDGSDVMPFTSVVTAAGGAGSIAATSPDAARWARLLYTGELLGPEMTAQMLNGVTATASYKPRVPYGLGVQAFPIGGRLSFGHSGRLLGFRAAIRHLPLQATTIAVLTNQSRRDPAVIVGRLLSVVFGPPAPCIRCVEPS